MEPAGRQQQRDVSPVVKFSVFLGIFMLRIFDGIPWIWGNLYVYVTSWYYAKGDETSGSLTNWLFAVDNLTFNFGVHIGGFIAKTIGIRLTVLVAIVVFNCGIILTYFSVQYSAIALCVTLGVMPGFSGGICEACQLSLIVRWTRHNRGLSASSVPSSNILGAVVMNLLLTAFINPANKTPDDKVQGMVMFTQPEIVDKVPHSFLLYGFLSFTLNISGFFLIRERPGSKNILIEWTDGLKNYFNSSDEIIHYEKPSGYVSLDNEHISLRHENNDEAALDNGDDNDVNKANSSDLTPRQALKTRTFYSLWLFSAMLSYAFFVLNNYYKTFGLIYIPDDHFLTAVVMVKCLCTPVCTWIAGFSVDKLGVKPTMIIVSTLFCFLSSFFYLTAANKWLYMFSCVAYGCALFSQFCLMASCCVKLFGETHFPTILGLTLSSSYVITLLLPPLFQWMITTYGWLVLFSSVGVLALCQVIVLVIGLPEKNDYAHINQSTS